MNTPTPSFFQPHSQAIGVQQISKNMNTSTGSQSRKQRTHEPSMCLIPLLGRTDAFFVLDVVNQAAVRALVVMLGPAKGLPPTERLNHDAVVQNDLVFVPDRAVKVSEDGADIWVEIEFVLN